MLSFAAVVVRLSSAATAAVVVRGLGSLPTMFCDGTVGSVRGFGSPPALFCVGAVAALLV